MRLRGCACTCDAVRAWVRSTRLAFGAGLCGRCRLRAKAGAHATNHKAQAELKLAREEAATLRAEMSEVAAALEAGLASTARDAARDAARSDTCGASSSRSSRSGRVGADPKRVAVVAGGGGGGGTRSVVAAATDLASRYKASQDELSQSRTSLQTALQSLQGELVVAKRVCEPDSQAQMPCPIGLCARWHPLAHMHRHPHALARMRWHACAGKHALAHTHWRACAGTHARSYPRAGTHTLARMRWHACALIPTRWHTHAGAHALARMCAHTHALARTCWRACAPPQENRTLSEMVSDLVAQFDRAKADLAHLQRNATDASAMREQLDAIRHSLHEALSSVDTVTAENLQLADSNTSLAERITALVANYRRATEALLGANQAVEALMERQRHTARERAAVAAAGDEKVQRVTELARRERAALSAAALQALQGLSAHLKHTLTGLKAGPPICGLRTEQLSARGQQVSYRRSNAHRRRRTRVATAGRARPLSVRRTCTRSPPPSARNEPLLLAAASAPSLSLPPPHTPRVRVSQFATGGSSRCTGVGTVA